MKKLQEKPRCWAEAMKYDPEHWKRNREINKQHKEVKMGNFKQTTKWLEQGKKVRRPSWEEDSYWKLGVDDTICWVDGTKAHIHLNQINATDFEVYEKEKAMENKIKKELKEFIKALQKLI